MPDYYEPFVDISKFQVPVNFDTMWAAGVRLVIMRLSIGSSYKDPEFDNFYASAKARGFKVGVYHVVRPSISAVAQFNNIVTSLPFELLDIPPILDCEQDDNQSKSVISQVIADIAQSVFNLWTRHSPIYTRGEWWNTYTISKPIFKLCPLWIARYTTLNHPWNDAPALRPHDWTEWAAWQYSADGNNLGETYGVGSDDIDLDRGNAATLEGTLALLNGSQPPPPDPTPTGDYMYLADVIYLAPGTTYRNIRSKPDSTGSDAGLDVGDVVITDKGLPVYEVQTNSEGNWYMLKKGSIVGWVLGKVGTTEYLHLTPLVPMLQVTAGVDKVNLWYWKDKNGAGKPIMVQPPTPRPQFLLGARFIVDPVKVDADGEEDYYKVLNPFSASPPALPPTPPWEGWYCKVGDVF